MFSKKPPDVPYRPELNGELYKKLLAWAKCSGTLQQATKRELKDALEACEYQVPIVDWDEVRRECNRRGCSEVELIIDRARGPRGL